MKTLFVERGGYVLEITVLTKEQFKETGLPMYTDGIVTCDKERDVFGGESYSNVQPSCTSTASDWNRIMYEAWSPASEARVQEHNIKEGSFYGEISLKPFSGFEERPVIVTKTIHELVRNIDSCKREELPKVREYVDSLCALLGNEDPDIVALYTKLEIATDPFFDNDNENI